MRRAETSILAAARSWGLGVTRTGHVNDLQLLADLQHYGAPTRLIDFTSNPVTALWFACQNGPSGTRLNPSGVILALNVTEWNRHAAVGGPSSNAWGYLENPSGWTLMEALERGRPFLVESPKPNSRLRAQEGFFAAGALPPGSRSERERRLPFASIDVSWQSGDPIGLESALTGPRDPATSAGRIPFVAVVIRDYLKPRILAYLENSYNRRAGVLFPDYSGFVEYGLPPLN